MFFNFFKFDKITQIGKEIVFVFYTLFGTEYHSPVPVLHGQMLAVESLRRICKHLLNWAGNKENTYMIPMMDLKTKSLLFSTSLFIFMFSTEVMQSLQSGLINNRT